MTAQTKIFEPVSLGSSDGKARREEGRLRAIEEKRRADVQEAFEQPIMAADPYLMFPQLDIPVTVLAEEGQYLPNPRKNMWTEVEQDYEARPLFYAQPASVDRAAERKKELRAKQLRRVGDMLIDFGTVTCIWGEEEVTLTRSELLIVEALTQIPGQVMTRDQIIDRVFGPGFHVTDRTVDSHMKRIRKAFRKVDPGWAGITTHYGFGYSWNKTYI